MPYFRILCLQVAFVLIGVGISYSAYAQDCSQTSPPTCSYVPVGSTVSITPQQFTANPTCQQVKNNNCVADIMVPTGTSDEWASFIANHEACATVSDCNKHTVWARISPGAGNSAIIEIAAAGYPEYLWQTTGGNASSNFTIPNQPNPNDQGVGSLYMAAMDTGGYSYYNTYKSSGGLFANSWMTHIFGDAGAPADCSYVAATSTGINNPPGPYQPATPNPYGAAGTKFSVWYCGAVPVNRNYQPYFTIP